jgi:hypothetical protein
MHGEHRRGAFFVPHDLAAPVTGSGTGPLTGLTAGVKDMYDIAGSRTGAGNPTWLDAPVRALVIAADAKAFSPARAGRCRGLKSGRSRRTASMRGRKRSASCRLARSGRAMAISSARPSRSSAPRARSWRRRGLMSTVIVANARAEPLTV